MREASRPVMLFVLLVLATVLVSALPLPWKASGMLFALASIVQGLLALRAVWRAGIRGVMVPVLAVGLTFACLSAFSYVALLVAWPVWAEHEACLRDALTISAAEACDQQLQDALTEQLKRASRTGR